MLTNSGRSGGKTVDAASSQSRGEREGVRRLDELTDSKWYAAASQRLPTSILFELSVWTIVSRGHT